MTAITHTQYDAETRLLSCGGEWNITSLPELQHFFEKIEWPTYGEIKISGKDVTVMDTAGAWLLNEWVLKLQAQNVKVSLRDFSERAATLIDLVNQRTKESEEIPQPVRMNFLAQMGQSTLQQWHGLFSYLSFIGLLSFETLRLIVNPARLRWGEFINVIYRTGLSALPIIALLSFMIGVVITYQMGLQLQNYGANIFIVDLLGLAILREFGPLITAIMVAGRSGSAYTAQLGMMKLNQEIDALDTMGVTLLNYCYSTYRRSHCRFALTHNVG